MRRNVEKKAAIARRDMKWEQLNNYLMFPEVATEIRENRMPELNNTCSMCGKFCAMKRGADIFKNNIKGDKKGDM